MTAVPVTSVDVAAGGSLAARRLLRVDAALCGGLGLVAATAAPGLADLLGVSSATAVRWVGVALVVYALDLLLAARSRFARQAVLVAGAGSLLWEAASLAVAAFGGLSGVGQVLVVAQGLATGVLGVLQLRAGRRQAV